MWQVVICFWNTSVWVEWDEFTPNGNEISLFLSIQLFLCDFIVNLLFSPKRMLVIFPSLNIS